MNQEDRVPEVSVVLSVYRNAQLLRKLHSRLQQVFRAHNLRYEMIFVDDACPEGSLEVLKQLALEDPCVAVLAVERNMGQQHAILQGLLYSRAEAIVVMDADLQDPPEAIPKLLCTLKEGYAAVFAGRRGSYQDAGRLFTSKIYKRLMHWSCGTPADAGLFLIMNRQMADSVLANWDRHPFVMAMVGCTGLPTESIPVPRTQREVGRSAYSSWKRLKAGLGALIWVWSWKLGLKKRLHERPFPRPKLRECIGERFNA